MIKVIRKEMQICALNFRNAGSRVDPPRPAPAPRAKVEKPPPKGKYGEEWNRYFESAKEDGFVDPEKFADSALRTKERALELESKRHKIVRTNKKVSTGMEICKARTLKGEACKFKATCGEFCKKHAPMWIMLDKKPTGTEKGFICIERQIIEKIFGKPNGNNEWNIEIDSTKLSMSFKNEDSTLHISSVNIDSIAKVRKIIL
jgi:hypothetical protein